jgi:hypothetical protein
VKRWALKDQMQSHHVGLEADTDQTPKSAVVEAASVAGSAAVAVAFAGGGYCHCDVRASVHVAFPGSADTVAGVGTMVAPDEPADRSVQKTHSAVVQSQEVGKACSCAAGVGPSWEVIVGTEAEAVGNPQVAVWDDAGEATLAGLA